jgi:hypothetical protein
LLPRLWTRKNRNCYVVEAKEKIHTIGRTPCPPLNPFAVVR